MCDVRTRRFSGRTRRVVGADEQRSSGIWLRAFRGEQDAAQAAAILRDTAEATVWSETGLRKMSDLSGVTAFVSGTEGELSGILIGRRAADEGEILNLAVSRGKRWAGEGGRLVRALLEEYRLQGVSRVFLEVRESNAGAIAFYERLGFRAVGRRNAYYQRPSEAALVMELRLVKSTEAAP